MLAEKYRAGVPENPVLHARIGNLPEFSSGILAQQIQLGVYAPPLANLYEHVGTTQRFAVLLNGL